MEDTNTKSKVTSPGLETQVAAAEGGSPQVSLSISQTPVTEVSSQASVTGNTTAETDVSIMSMQFIRDGGGNPLVNAGNECFSPV